jgi:S-adenosyl methyltransferase
VADEGATPEFDMTRPTIARAYDAVLGGKDNFAPDRAIAAELTKTVPQIGDLAQYNRAILGRGVRFLAERAGIRQFLDLGSGLPTVENTHQVAQRYAPDARVVYVDIDPMVLAHGRALLETDKRTAVVTADLREPDRILAHPEVTRLIDLSEPVAVMLVGILHHLHDDEDPEAIVRAYMNAVPAGSHLFVTSFCDSGPDAAALEKTLLRFLGTGRFRKRNEIERYFDGLEMVEPGLVYLPEWHPDRPVSGDLSVVARLMIGGIARKGTPR